jgi:hypothetical protein
MTFISNDKEGVLRLVDFDPAGMSFLPSLIQKTPLYDTGEVADNQTRTHSMENG